MNLDLIIKQYETFQWTTPVIYEPDGVTPLNLTGYTAKMGFKRDKCSNDPLIYSALSTGGSPQITIPDQTQSANTGTLNVIIPATDTGNFTFTIIVYDLIVISPSSIVTRAFEGQVELDRGVSIYP